MDLFRARRFQELVNCGQACALQCLQCCPWTEVLYLEGITASLIRPTAKVYNVKADYLCDVEHSEESEEFQSAL